MLKNLLKYEFRATGRTYGGLYLVWLLVALAMGSRCGTKSGTMAAARSGHT